MNEEPLLPERLSDDKRQELIKKWISPSTEAEAVRQDRAERMVKDAIGAHAVHATQRSRATPSNRGSRVRLAVNARPSNSLTRFHRTP